jgi:hypothetical protein
MNCIEIRQVRQPSVAGRIGIAGHVYHRRICALHHTVYITYQRHRLGGLLTAALVALRTRVLRATPSPRAFPSLSSPGLHDLSPTALFS